jgi:hypothetical protein
MCGVTPIQIGQADCPISVIQLGCNKSSLIVSEPLLREALRALVTTLWVLGVPVVLKD